VPAPVGVDVMVTAHAEGLQREVGINGSVLVAPALDIKGFAQRLVALADEDEDRAGLGRRDDARADEDIAEDIAGGRDDDDRLRALAVNEEFNLLRCHQDLQHLFPNRFQQPPCLPRREMR
jgi:hypothetical protein